MALLVGLVAVGWFMVGGSSADGTHKTWAMRGGEEEYGLERRHWGRERDNGDDSDRYDHSGRDTWGGVADGLREEDVDEAAFDAVIRGAFKRVVRRIVRREVARARTGHKGCHNCGRHHPHRSHGTYMQEPPAPVDPRNPLPPTSVDPFSPVHSPVQSPLPPTDVDPFAVRGSLPSTNDAASNPVQSPLPPTDVDPFSPARDPLPSTDDDSSDPVQSPLPPTDADPFSPARGSLPSTNDDASNPAQSPLPPTDVDPFSPTRDPLPSTDDDSSSPAQSPLPPTDVDPFNSLPSPTSELPESTQTEVPETNPEEMPVQEAHSQASSADTPANPSTGSGAAVQSPAEDDDQTPFHFSDAEDVAPSMIPTDPIQLLDEEGHPNPAVGSVVANSDNLGLTTQSSGGQRPEPLPGIPEMLRAAPDLFPIP